MTEPPVTASDGLDDARPAEPTSVDPGEAIATPAPTAVDPAASAAAPPPTSVDPASAAAPPPTSVDPAGRGAGTDRATADDRPRAHDDEWGEGRLPHALAQRFRVVGIIEARSGQADLFLVCERGSSEILVLKLYYQGQGLAKGMAEILPQLNHPHLIRLVDHGHAAGRYYEVMERAADGNLLELLGRPPKGVSANVLRAIVEQVASALHHLHQKGAVHRDLKPANILVRSAENPLDLAVTDFGISTPVRDGKTYTTTKAGSFHYFSPEFIAAGRVAPAIDWWALGISVIELATGHNPFGRFDEQVVREHLSARPVDLSGLTDPRVRLLCQGLLANDFEDRWGFDQVSAWLRGESPKVAEQRQRAAPHDIAAETLPAIRPLTFLGRDHFDRRLLANTMIYNWEQAAHRLFASPDRAWSRLRQWLEQFERNSEESEGVRAELDRIGDMSEPPSVRLLPLVQLLDPWHGPVYLLPAPPVQVETLPAIVGEALAAPNAQRTMVRQLFDYGLLPRLARAPGGEGLREIHEQWSDLEKQWRRVRRGLGRQDARFRTELANADRGYILTMLLWLVLDRRPATDYLTGLVQAERPLVVREVDWFSALAGSTEPLRLLAAHILLSAAMAEADQIALRQANEAADREWRDRFDALFQWYQNDGRYMAVGWAAVGIALVITLWAAVLIGSGSVGLASPDAVAMAWGMVSTQLFILSAAEVSLAAVLGGPYHPRYSLVGGIVDAGARAVRPIRRNGRLILLALLAGLAVLVAMTVWLPMVLPTATLVAYLVWTVFRCRMWFADRRAREEERQQPEPDDPAAEEAAEPNPPVATTIH